MNQSAYERIKPELSQMSEQDKKDLAKDLDELLKGKSGNGDSSRIKRRNRLMDSTKDTWRLI